jgi:hypothetical protein
MANALMEGTAITSLEFAKCKFSTGECATTMANGLARNTSVSYMKVKQQRGQPIYSVLPTVLSSNSTLRRLDLGPEINDNRPDLSPVLLALGKNTGIKTLKVDSLLSMDESLCTAMQNGLGMNETLESLVLNHTILLDVDLWYKAFSFLRTSTAIKSLKVQLGCDSTTESCLPPFISKLRPCCKRTRHLRVSTFES